MIIDKQKEEEFFSKDFNFSYSSLNRLLFSPSLFYKDYILKEKEIRLDKHLIEGSVIHCLLFEADKLKEKFKIVPGKAPSDSVRKVLYNMQNYTDAKKLDKVEDFVILDSLKEINLYQSLKKDEQRLAKIRTSDNADYWEFMMNDIKNIIDLDTLNKCKERVELLNENEEVKAALTQKQSDFELDPITTYAEAYLKCDLANYDFGLHGYIDFYEINDDTKEVTIYDLKTTSKSIADFKDTVEYYNYWLQAAVYSKLVFENLPEDKKEYTIRFRFIVIDSYDQVYIFNVSIESMSSWMDDLFNALEAAKYHFDTKNFNLPYEFLVRRVNL